LPGRFRVRRVRPAGVHSCPVWDLPVEGALLWQRLGVPRVEQLQGERRALAEVSQALAATLAEALRLLRPRLGFDAVWLGGGLTALPGFAAAVASAVPAPRVTISERGRWSFEPGGRALCAEAALIDVGQTAIKAVFRGLRVLRERDLRRLPLRLIGEDGRSRDAPPADAADFLASALREVLRLSPASLVLALPCPLDDDGTPGPCTYGFQGDRSLVPEALRRADEGGPPCDVLLLEDSELAALAARAELGLSPEGRGLALGLGFGPGAALWQA
jgi:hypothetical protein